tara:strand:+ start:773 stop:1585 length:813 start_codon:yes stop_codon:yes gene_type:complete
VLKPFLLALALLLPAGTQAEPARTISELLNASGVDVSYGRLGDVMANGAGTVGLSIDATSAWRRAALAAFDGGLVIDQLVRALQARHTMEDFSAAASFFDSALGRRVTLAENAAQKITDEAMVKAEGGEILARLMQEDPARLALYRRMVEESGLLESALASTMSMNLAMVTGMQASGLLPYSMSQDEMIAMLNDQRGAIATELERSIYIQAAFTYAEISDADMQAYADFLTGPVGRDFYAALNIAISDVLNARARDFGEIFAELLQESAL